MKDVLNFLCWILVENPKALDIRTKAMELYTRTIRDEMKGSNKGAIYFFPGVGALTMLEVDMAEVMKFLNENKKIHAIKHIRYFGRITGRDHTPNQYGTRGDLPGLKEAKDMVEWIVENAEPKVTALVPFDRPVPTQN